MPILQNVNSNSSNGGGIYVQRGSVTSAGNVTINEVDMDKTFVLSVSKGSDGYVASRGDITGKSYIVSRDLNGYKYYSLLEQAKIAASGAGISSYANTPYSYIDTTTTISGGSTDLTVKEYSAVLTSPTTLYCDGACEWQVIEIK